MSLNWNVAKVANSETVCFHIAEHDDEAGRFAKGDKRLNLTTEALIFATMGVGLGSITQANHLEFFGRLHLFEKINGGMRTVQTAPGVWGRQTFTLAEVRDHIGLTTNAGTESRTAWQKRLVENHIRSALYDAQRAERDAADKAAKIAAAAYDMQTLDMARD